MSKNMKEKGSKGLSYILLALLVVVLLFILYVNISKIIAKNIAVKYLKSTYMEQMKPVAVRYSFIDPSMYHVYFTSQNNPELSFEVLVMTDFSLARSSDDFSPDDYLLKYFKFHFVKEIQSIIDDLGKEEIKARIAFCDQPLYSFKVSEALKEDMPYEEMEPYIDYELCFDVNKIWTDTDKYAEACMMLELIISIQASEYSPEEITFSYLTVNKEKYKFFIFSEWDNISDVSQIYEILD